MSDTAVITRTFADVDSLLQLDNGVFWNHQLYGPLLVVNPETRVFIANENSASNGFKRINSAFSDSLPHDVNIANTAFDWNNKRWSMVALPLPDDRMARNNLFIHELFHRIQPEVGFDNLQELDNGHLDTYEGRILLKLELEALVKSLAAETEETRNVHLKNALGFRASRQSSEERKKAENSLEINEGLAEYTAVMLSGRTEKETIHHFVQSVKAFYENPTFVRSFAYQTIPIYGFLLSGKNRLWHLEVSRNTDLTDYFARAFGLEALADPNYAQTARDHAYGYEAIEALEKVRENERLAKIEGYKLKFMEGPTLKLYFENMNISFDPRNITPLEGVGTVYPALRVTDNFGVLTVENDALLSADWSHVVVTQPTEVNERVVKGAGWTLELQPDWSVEKTEDGFILQRAE